MVGPSQQVPIPDILPWDSQASEGIQLENLFKLKIKLKILNCLLSFRTSNYYYIYCYFQAEFKLKTSDGFDLSPIRMHPWAFCHWSSRMRIPWGSGDASTMRQPKKEFNENLANKLPKIESDNQSNLVHMASEFINAQCRQPCDDPSVSVHGVEKERSHPSRGSCLVRTRRKES